MIKVEDLPDILRKQADIIEERAKEHGSFSVFERAAEIADVDVDCVLSVLIAIKQARLESNPHNDDSFIDLLNYSAIRYMLKRNTLRDCKNDKG